MKLSDLGDDDREQIRQWNRRRAHDVPAAELRVGDYVLEVEGGPHGGEVTRVKRKGDVVKFKIDDLYKESLGADETVPVTQRGPE